MSPEIREITPEQAGWQPILGKPRTWLTNEGEVFIFPPGEPQIIFKLDDAALATDTGQ